MARYVLGESGAKKLRTLLNASGSSGSVYGEHGHVVNEDAFPDPYAVRWAASVNEGEGAWIIWLPSDEHILVVGARGVDPSKDLDEADGDYPEGWYIIPDDALDGEEGGTLWLNIDGDSASFASEASGDSYAIAQAVVEDDGSRSVYQYVTSAIIITGTTNYPFKVRSRFEHDKNGNKRLVVDMYATGEMVKWNVFGVAWTGVGKSLNPQGEIGGVGWQNIHTGEWGSDVVGDLDLTVSVNLIGYELTPSKSMTSADWLSEKSGFSVITSDDTDKEELHYPELVSGTRSIKTHVKLCSIRDGKVDVQSIVGEILLTELYPNFSDGGGGGGGGVFPDSLTGDHGVFWLEQNGSDVIVHAGAYNKGGISVECAGGPVTVSENTYICLETTGRGTGAKITTYKSFEEITDAQNEADKYVHPLYLVDAVTPEGAGEDDEEGEEGEDPPHTVPVVKVDYRCMPQLQLFEDL